MEQESKGWSLKGLLFAQHYYAGYGELKKAIVYSLLGGFPLFGIIIAILCGKNAKKDLPIGKQKFKWINVVITITITIVSSIAWQVLVQMIKGA